MRRFRQVESLVAALHRVFARARHRRIDEIVTGRADGDAGSLRGHRTCAVVTYKRDGTAVATPVWFALRDGCIYFRAERSSGKAKRLRTNTSVLVAACTRRGKPLGAAFPGTARLLHGDEAAAAEEAIQSAFGVGRAIYERVLTHPDGVYVEVWPRRLR